MPVDIFTKEGFEAALPVHKDTGAKLWIHVGLIDGEHTYRVSPFCQIPYSIEVRSSVGPNGKSASTGEDSIRAWIVNSTGKVFGSKVSRWTTRLPGWNDRLLDILRKLAGMIKEIADCPNCGKPCPPFKVKKAGPNKGRLFSKCVNPECNHQKFTWLAC